MPSSPSTGKVNADDVVAVVKGLGLLADHIPALVADSKEAIVELEKKTIAIQAQIDSLDTVLADSLTKNATKIAADKAKLQVDLETFATSVTSQKLVLQAQLDKLNSDIVDTERKAAESWTSQRKTMDSVIEQYNKDKEILKEQVDGLNSDIKTLSEKRDLIQAEITALRNRIGG